MRNKKKEIPEKQTGTTAFAFTFITYINPKNNNETIITIVPHGRLWIGYLHRTQAPKEKLWVGMGHYAASTSTRSGCDCLLIPFQAWVSKLYAPAEPYP